MCDKCAHDSKLFSVAMSGRDIRTVGIVFTELIQAGVFDPDLSVRNELVNFVNQLAMVLEGKNN